MCCRWLEVELSVVVVVVGVGVVAVGGVVLPRVATRVWAGMLRPILLVSPSRIRTGPWVVRV